MIVVQVLLGLMWLVCLGSYIVCGAINLRDNVGAGDLQVRYLIGGILALGFLGLLLK